MSAVEDVAAAIAEQVRGKGWTCYPQKCTVDVSDSMNGLIATIWCKDASQAKRLAEMMRAPPTPVFDAMNLPELPAFPSVRGKA